MGKTKHCIYCGSQLDEGAPSCWDCGEFRDCKGTTSNFGDPGKELTVDDLLKQVGKFKAEPRESFDTIYVPNEATFVRFSTETMPALPSKEPREVFRRAWSQIGVEIRTTAAIPDGHVLLMNQLNLTSIRIEHSSDRVKASNLHYVCLAGEDCEQCNAGLDNE